MGMGKGDTVDMRAMLRLMAAGAAAVVLLAGSVSCGDVTRQGRAPTVLVIDAVQAAEVIRAAEAGR